MKESNNVLITSFVPIRTLSAPAMLPHTPPAIAAARRGTIQASGPGSDAAPP